MKNLYIAGCGGMLGDAFYNIFSKKFNLKCTDKLVNEKWISKLDFTNYNNYKKDVESHDTNILIHLGAKTSLEECELDPHETYLNNTTSVEHAVDISNQLNIPLVFISTAGIFDGYKDIYDDEDIPNPLSHYGKSKYLSEKFIETNSKNYLICRAGWMMGGGMKKDKKFVNKIIKQIINNKKILHIVNDKNGTPTYTYDFANQVLHLIENNINGRFNVVCQGLTSRLEVTREILNFFKLNDVIKIKEVNSDFFKKDYHAQRPFSERLINSRLNKLSLNIMRNWKVCLYEYLNKDYKNLFNENN